MSIVRASSRFQVVIPKHLRTKLGIKSGQRLMVTDKDGAIMLTPIPADLVEYLCGVLKGEASMAEELMEERGRERERE